MDFLDLFKAHILPSPCTIAIGLGENSDQNYRIYSAACNVNLLNQNQIILIGNSDQIQELRQSTNEENETMHLISDENPYKLLIENYIHGQPIIDQNGKEYLINGIIRGGLSSATFLKILRNFQSILTDSSEISIPQITDRLALLETANGYQFFFAPVGIDEANGYEEKQQFLEEIISFFQTIAIEPKIALLSGGRLGDIGRDELVDKTILDAEKLSQTMTDKYPALNIKHYQILIEDAIQDEANVILAPEGIAGNLIYRTLIHLGKGKSYGALYLSYYNQMKKIIIDTSRIAPQFEIEGAIYFAEALL
jgi:predicted methyltransferase MtxX (methanogen marker protein 4)